MIGLRFNYLTVIEKSSQGYKCLCDCGTFTIVHAYRLKSSRTKSCGCMRTKLIGEAHTTHGKSGSSNKTRAKIYSIWANMKRRCYGENNDNYEYYGGRGIKVCDRWLNSFENFYNDMGDPPDGTTLDRKDNNGNYEPSNCKWSTYDEQNNNKRQRGSLNG